MNDSERTKAFELFAEGFRPSDIYDKVKVKKHTLYWYYELWKKELKTIEFELEAEEKAEKLQQEAEQQQEEAEQTLRTQQQETKRLADELHAIEQDLSLYQHYPGSLTVWWATHSEVNRVYSSPDEYLKALRKRRDYLQALLRQRSSSVPA